MTDEQYASTQDQLLVISSIVNSMDLDGFLQRIEIAESVGPIIDPTLCQKGQDNLGKIKRIAQAARSLQQEVRDILGVTK